MMVPLLVVLVSVAAALLVAQGLVWLLARRFPRDTITGQVIWLLAHGGGAGLGVVTGLVVAGVHTPAAIVNLGLRLLGVELANIAGTRVTVATIVILAFVLVFSWWASQLLQRAVRRSAQLRKLGDEGSIGVAERLIHYTVMLLGFGVALQTAGVNLSAFFAAGAVFAFGLGFALQNVSENFVSGVLLLVERAIKPGDVLLVEGELVRVEQMGIRATVCRTLDDHQVIVPNSVLAQGKVKNYTLTDPSHRIRIKVGVHYDSDVEQVIDVLLAAGRKVQPRDAPRPPRVLFREFGSHSLEFELSVWVRTPWLDNVLSSDIRRAVWHALRDNHITIAYNQMDIHFDREALDAMQRRR